VANPVSEAASSHACDHSHHDYRGREAASDYESLDADGSRILEPYGPPYDLGVDGLGMDNLVSDGLALCK